MKRSHRPPVVLLLAALAAACPGAPPRPTLTAEPPPGSVIGADSGIRLSFSTSMQPKSLALGGPLGAAIDSVVWTDGAFPSDTVLLTSSGGFAAGAGSLVVDATSAEGAPLTQVELEYVVDAAGPAFTTQPAGDVTLAAVTPILLHFDESVSVSSLLLSDALGAAVGSQTWSASGAPDNTVRLLPSGAWPDGAGRSLGVQVADLRGNVSNRTVTFSVDAVAPSASPTPVSGSTVSGLATVTLTFSEPMQPTSLALSGDLAAFAAAPLWAAGAQSVAVTPASAWPPGAAQLVVDAADVAGNPMTTLTVSFTVAGPAATATLSPAAGSILDNAEPIVVTFSRSMQPATLVLSGTLGAATGATSWSSGSAPDDTVALTPSGSWPAGPGLTLSIEASTSDGVASTGSASFDVAVVYVSVTHPAASDSNPGTRALPMSTLPAALGRAAGLYSPGQVLVAQGTYEVPPAGLALAPAISLVGGHAVDWSTRAPKSHLTRIADTAQSATVLVVADGAAITGSTVLTGFELIASSNSGAHALEISNGAAPVIRDNVLSTLSGSQTLTLNAAGAALIERNDIQAPALGGNTVWVINNSTPVFRNNVILATGSGTYGARGLEVSGSTVTLENNLVATLSGSPRFGLYLTNNALAVVENNILQSSSVGGTERSYCIFEGGGNVSRLRNNDLFGCPTALFAAYVGTGGNCPTGGTWNCLTTADELNDASQTTGGAAANASGNIEVIVPFAADYRYSTSGATPCAASRGGLPLPGVEVDRDGAARTSPLSQGPYEFDGACAP